MCTMRVLLSFLVLGLLPNSVWAEEKEADSAQPASAPTSAPATQPNQSNSVQKTQDDGAAKISETENALADDNSFESVHLTEDEWRARLTPKQFYILREKGTERANSGALLHNKKHGTYRCAGCNAPLFSSKTKFNSGTGWPSFYRSLRKRVKRVIDRSHRMVRTEIVCARCRGHLGHVFRDGPKPTGLRHCVNSLALTFEETPQKTDNSAQ